MLTNKKILSMLVLALSIYSEQALSIASFIEAKQVACELFSTRRITLYCNCEYNSHNKINLASCGMQAARYNKRAHRMEWEHMMPAENFGRHLPCWRKAGFVGNKKISGRKWCEKTDARFNTMEGELYNIWPTVGLVNQMRSNYRFANIETHTEFYGCNVQIDPKSRKFTPANHARGIVARANLFMSEKYAIHLSKAQKQLFLSWNKQYPPSLWEKQWAAKVAKIEGYVNPWVLGAK